MLFWDLKWKEHRADLTQLRQSQLLNLSLACIDDSLSLLNGALAGRFGSDNVATLSNVVTALWAIFHRAQSDNRELEDLELCLRSDIHHEGKPGLYDIAMALFHIVLALKSDLTPKTTSEALSYAYQSILDCEIISRLDEVISESEVCDREAANSLCTKCIERQLHFLNVISAGNVIEPRNVVPRR
jgi:hypothetical protein